MAHCCVLAPSPAHAVLEGIMLSHVQQLEGKHILFPSDAFSVAFLLFVCLLIFLLLRNVILAMPEPIIQQSAAAISSSSMGVGG